MLLVVVLAAGCGGGHDRIDHQVAEGLARQADAVAVSLGNGDALEGGLAPAGTEIDLGAARWLLNPGSVGQPRDGDARAAWLLLDLDAGRATFHRARYAVKRTQAEIRERGLPAALADRLEHGL